jgi:hypothetical protein
MDYGIKVSQPGFDVNTATGKNLVFSSKYQTLHVHSQGSGTIKDSTGRTVTIAHNLGYVPKFLVHTQLDSVTNYGDANSYFIAPYVLGDAGLAIMEDRQVISWADSTNLYIKVGGGFGYDEYHTGLEDNNYGTNLNGLGYIASIMYLGKWSGYTADGAIRLNSVNIAQGADIYKASLVYYIEGAGDSGNKPVSIYGADEDNAGDLSSSPFGMAKTTATRNETISSSLGVGSTWSPDVTAMVQEIVDRAGWSIGNHMVFFVMDNGTTGDNNYIYDGNAGNFYTSYSYLRVLMSDTLANYKYTIFLDKIDA